MSNSVIEMNNVHKSFKSITALAGLNLEVPAGSIYGFLGPNGAGKTTAIKILMGMIRPDNGELRVLGLPFDSSANAAKIRERIGFVPEYKETYPYMTVEEMIHFTRPFYPKWRDDLEKRYVMMFELPLKKKIPTLSKGMHSKLMLLLAISRGAELLIMDEPMEGMDPAISDVMLGALVDLTASEGTTVFFSSHQIADVEQIADHVTIINQGIALMSGAIDDMKLRYQRIQITFPDVPPEPVQWGDGVVQVEQEGRMVSILACNNLDTLIAKGRSFPGTVVETYPLTLKEIFLGHIRNS